MTVGDMLNRVTSEELTEWKLYFQFKAQDAEVSAATGGVF